MLNTRSSTEATYVRIDDGLSVHRKTNGQVVVMAITKRWAGNEKYDCLLSFMRQYFPMRRAWEPA